MTQPGFVFERVCMCAFNTNLSEYCTGLLNSMALCPFFLYNLVADLS